ncbi:leucine-rich repeat receptor-like protein kinase PEPR1 [Silene latifolia]|uniref:leucine-rich repeat receptor-like protein kinase PEPR1 n=1 Tax=Silene latifolia TaxID=37657 RepID=UPI003D77AC35
MLICLRAEAMLLDFGVLREDISNSIKKQNLRKLSHVELFNNRLSGEVPVSFWKIQTLEYVIILVYGNNLTGELPWEITQLKNLKNISLYENNFSGIIPRGLGINSSLLQVEFTNNRFTGEIPPHLCFGKQLEVLNLSENMLTGSIPPGIGSCSSLTRLRLEQNKLTGVIPEFAENHNLSFMDVSGNNIEGMLPQSLGKCRELSSINFSRNKLKGVLPPQFGNMTNLQAVNLSHNRLTGPLPYQLGNCNKLLQFDASFNLINGSLPESLSAWTTLSVLNLRENKLSGGIPIFLSESQMLTELQLGGNSFGGVIPSSIGTLTTLRYALNFSSNGLTGELPSSLVSLVNLQRLDVSQNNLSGSLSSLGNLHSLIEINVSYNHFSGPIPPTLLGLLGSSPSSFLGNSELCAKASTYIRPCDGQWGNHNRRLDGIHVAIIALGATLSVVFIILCVCYIFLRHKRRRKDDAEISVQRGASFFLNKILQATENLCEDYMIGRGAHGIVYKASLCPDETYAVKKLSLGDQRTGNGSMVREIETLGKVRHQNLVKLCDFWFGKDYGLILYEYMENGSLYDILHGTRSNLVLPWDVRYKIALGTADGLAYLHFDCRPAIVHRDIKPENILLDSDMEPHTSDFGIAKLLDQSSPSTQSSVVTGTTGYIAPGTDFCHVC